MVAKTNLLRAAKAIEGELWKFIHQSTSGKVHVFESEWGHLQALVGHDGFKDMNIVERQEAVWNHLREHVAQEYLTFLYAVHPMDLEEYDVRTHEV